MNWFLITGATILGWCLPELEMIITRNTRINEMPWLVNLLMAIVLGLLTAGLS